MMQQQRLEMRVAVVFAGLMMLVVRPRRGQLLKPLTDVFNQPALMVVHVNGGSNVHGRDKTQSVLHAAALHNLFHLVGNVHHLPPLARFKYQVFGMTFHVRILTAYPN